jgi:hypothetical protein
MNSWRRVASLTGRYGKATRGRYTSREAPTAATASRFRPTTCVSHAAGTLSTLQATGSAPSSPITRGLAPRWSAHAVSTPPPAQAAKTSAAAPSKSEARSDGRSCAQGLSAGASLPGSGPDDNAGAEPGSDSPGCGTAGPRPMRAMRSRSGGLPAMIRAHGAGTRPGSRQKARIQREAIGQRHVHLRDSRSARILTNSIADTGPDKYRQTSVRDGTVGAGRRPPADHNIATRMRPSQSNSCRPSNISSLNS